MAQPAKSPETVEEQHAEPVAKAEMALVQEPEIGSIAKSEVEPMGVEAGEETGSVRSTGNLIDDGGGAKIGKTDRGARPGLRRSRSGED